ncbi:498_t:CDS:2 [Cetraspora pellucida]|uniref:498_t:CDS:1 n=1 Tax=Cetraspora pellucida TaxID=1433469 RepID=A0ACA9KBS4_9GLOM|nr:498_t:CDS:2 [Cetraspora pellucida]
MYNRTSTAKEDNTHLSTSKADMSDFTSQANITIGHPTLDFINNFNGNWADEINERVNTQQSASLNSTIKNNENSENSLANTHTLYTETHDSDTNLATYCADYNVGTLNQLPKKTASPQTKLRMQNYTLNSQHKETSDLNISETDNHITDLETLLQEEENQENSITIHNNRVNMKTKIHNKSQHLY